MMTLRPPIDLTVSEYAEAHRVLSVEDSPEPGKFKCWPFQVEMLDSFNEAGNRMAVYMTSAQIGKALDIKTPIATPCGWVAMGDLVVGDQIFDENGKVCTVTYCSPIMLQRDCYQVTFSDESSIVADADHLWTVDHGKWGKTDKRMTITTKEMLPQYKSINSQGKIRNNFSIPVTKPLELPQADLPIDPYVLGVWLGDGHNSTNKITINNEHLEIIDNVVNAGHRAMPVVMKDGYGATTFSIDPKIPIKEREYCFRGHNLKEVGLTSKQYCKKCAVQSSQHYQRGYKQDEKIEISLFLRLQANNLLKKFGGYKHIPKEYLRSSFQQRLKLIQGMMDTDGCCSTKGRCSYSTSDKPIADGFFELLASLGIKPKYFVQHPYAVKNGVRTPGKPSYVFTFIAYRDDFDVFSVGMKLERQPFKAGRRVSEVKNRKIVNIEQVSSVPVRCIQVDSPNHLFLAGKSMIPTHNTTILFNMLMYMVCARTGGITFMLPSEVIARDYSKARFSPMIRDCAKLAEKIPPGKANGNTILYKQWETGFVRFVASGNADKLASFPTPWLVIDELDRCEVVARNSAGVVEGNSLLLLFERMKRYEPRTFTLMTSTPSIKDTSQIYEYWLKSDQRYPYISCPHCSFEQFLAWDNFSWDGKSDQLGVYTFKEMIDTFHYKCESCKSKIFQENLPEFPPPTKWVPQNKEGEFPGFHINAFYTNSWKENFKKYLEAKSNQAKLMVWWNTTLGLPFSLEEIAVPDWAELKKRSVNYERGVVPSPACLLLGGADVQHTRIECVIVGVNRHRIWVVEHAIFNCEQGDNTANRDSIVWKNFRDFRHKTFPTESGHSLSPLAVAIDSRHRKDVVIREAKEDPTLIPVTGSPSIWDRDILPAQRGEINMGTATNRIWKAIDIQRYPLGVNLLKMDLYGRLNMSRTPAEVRNDDYPKEWIEFPTGLPSEFYKQLCGEVLEVNEDSRGKTKRNWRSDYENVEILDCMTYILGLFKIKNLHDWSDERWQLEEAEIGLGGPIEEKPSGPIVGKMF